MARPPGEYRMPHVVERDGGMSAAHEASVLKACRSPQTRAVLIIAVEPGRSQPIWPHETKIGSDTDRLQNKLHP